LAVSKERTEFDEVTHTVYSRLRALVVSFFPGHAKASDEGERRGTHFCLPDLFPSPSADAREGRAWRDRNVIALRPCPEARSEFAALDSCAAVLLYYLHLRAVGRESGGLLKGKT